MLLAIDVGNTQTQAGVYSGEELLHEWRVRTERQATADEPLPVIASPGIADAAGAGGVVPLPVPGGGLQVRGVATARHRRTLLHGADTRITSP